MSRKTKTLKVRRGFALKRFHYRQAAADLVASVADQFGKQTPLMIGANLGKHEAAVRKAITKEFRRRKQRVTFARSVPRSGVACVFDFTATDATCRGCGQSAVDLTSRIAVVRDAVVDRSGAPHRTISPCIACGAPSEPDPENAPVQGSATHDLNENPGSGDEIFPSSLGRELDAL
jgi:hypothetical protein